jgi:hypothetical protein
VFDIDTSEKDTDGNAMNSKLSANFHHPLPLILRASFQPLFCEAEVFGLGVAAGALDVF